MQTKPNNWAQRPPTEASPHPLLVAARTGPEGTPVRNRILRALPENEFQVVRPLLTAQELPGYTTLHEPGELIEFIHFPNCGLISIVVVTRERKSVEVSVIGREGLVGTAALVGLHRSSHRAVAQIGGEGFRMHVDTIRSMLPSTPSLQRLASRDAVLQGMQAAQSAACNRLHGVEQRLARWLLSMYDRVDEASLHITHDFLANMLGTDRPSVSLAAAALQKKGAIDYSRGVVQIAHRKDLEDAACECYRITRDFMRSMDYL